MAADWLGLRAVEGTIVGKLHEFGEGVGGEEDLLRAGRFGYFLLEPIHGVLGNAGFSSEAIAVARIAAHRVKDPEGKELFRGV